MSIYLKCFMMYGLLVRDSNPPPLFFSNSEPNEFKSVQKSRFQNLLKTAKTVQKRQFYLGLNPISFILK